MAFSKSQHRLDQPSAPTGLGYLRGTPAPVHQAVGAHSLNAVRHRYTLDLTSLASAQASSTDALRRRNASPVATT